MQCPLILNTAQDEKPAGEKDTDATQDDEEATTTKPGNPLSINTWR